MSDGATTPEAKKTASGGVGDDFVTASPLGAIERLVGAVQQGVGGVALAFRAGDADGDGEVERVRARG